MAVDRMVVAERVCRLRKIMTDRGYDAVVLRNNPDLRWLTGSERTFDFETAHTAFVTADSLLLHTDSRYFNTFHERLGDECPWTIDMDVVDPAWWVAQHVREARARVVAVEDTLDLAFFDSLSAELAKVSVACLLPRLHGDLVDLRQVKDAQEIDLMRRAQAVTDAAFDHICGFIEPGLTEQQVRVELENYMLSNGADALSFESIIAAGPNGANPHAQPGDYAIRRGDMVVMDFGAGYRDYHSDMTRTVVVGVPTDEQRHVYDVVRMAHEECAAAVHAGVIGSDIQALAVGIISDAGYGDCFRHGLGHGVGIQIHERPNFSRLYDKPIPEGSVVTIEPGIYLPGRFGIRLEDFGVVGKDGFEPLTRSTHDLVVID